MKLNIFSIPRANVQALKDKFKSVGLDSRNDGEQGEWKTTFYFSSDKEPNAIPWVAMFAEFFDPEDLPANLVYFGAYVFERGDRCYVLSFGKSHFYIRSFCDHDFGIELAKRIADEGDIKQTSSKKFAGKKKKQIKSYTGNTALDVESGESVDFLKAAVAQAERATFGPTAKFGASVLLTAPVDKDQICDLLDRLEEVRAKPARFELPRTSVITDPGDIAKYDAKLLAATATGQQLTDFTHTGHDIVGVDFVFSGNEQYTLTCRGHDKELLGDRDLDLEALQSYIAAQRIAEHEILKIRVHVDNEGQRSYSKPLKDSLDFIVDGENVMLSNGKWVRFNEDYIEQLDGYLDGITMEEPEDSLREVTTAEPAFNESDVVRSAGYVNADKDFSKVGTTMSTPVEAWDLHKGTTAYAVKFGTPHKLGYACDQAIAVLEIIRNNANVKTLSQPVNTYCLWFVVSNKKLPDRVTQINSLILKQKVEVWARKCRELGIEPRMRLSRRVETN